MKIAWLIFLTTACAPVGIAQDEITPPAPELPRSQARSVVMSKFGIVATSQTLASVAGTHVLESGGNAVDAAIAANAVLGVVEPMSNGLGGDLFAIVFEAKTGKLYGLNASGWSSSGLTADLLRARGLTKMPASGVFTVTVPGMAAGWDMLHKRFGTKPLGQVLSSAIYYAENGFPVTEIISASWQGAAKRLAEGVNTKDTFLPDGNAPKPGQLFRNRDLAVSLRLVARHGRDGFYKSRTADALLKVIHDLGAPMTREDLSEFQPEWVEPVSTTYRGWRVWELPPNEHGIAALQMLNMMERFPMARYGHNSINALHTMIEAKKIAYADMLRYTADPRFFRTPVARILSKEFAAERVRAINAGHAACRVDPAVLTSTELASKPGGDTIYLSAIDKDGNIVSLIQSNFSNFGSFIVPPGTGFALHNRGGLFTLRKGHPNELAPRKRPVHTILPAFMEKGDIRIGFGIMGGWNQAQAHAQFVSNVVDFGMNVQEALEAARFTKLDFDGCGVRMESRVDAKVRDALAARGHEIELAGPFSGVMGGGQAVMRDGNGVNFGGSDPRKDGAAVPEQPGLSVTDQK